MEALILIVVLFVLFLSLRFYRTGKLKYSSQLKHCADQQSLMIVLKDDIHQELAQKNLNTAFEKALVLLGMYDRLLVVLQDQKFFAYLQDPRHTKGSQLLNSLSSHFHEDYIELHSEVLRDTYLNSLKTLMELNRQLNLECDMARWNRPVAAEQKQVPSVEQLPPEVKNLFAQRLALCQQILEMGLQLLSQELARLSAQQPADAALEPEQAQAQAQAQAQEQAQDTAASEPSEVYVKLKPATPASPVLRDITVNQNPDLQVQQLYTKYQKLLSLILRTERLTCLALNQFSLLPVTSTKLQDLGIK